MNTPDERKERLVAGFINTMIEDQTMTLIEQCDLDVSFPDVVVTDEQRETIKALLYQIISDLPLGAFNDPWNDPASKGGDLYIGLMYDSYYTPLKFIDHDFYGDVYVFINDGDELAQIEGYFSYNGEQYPL